MTCKKKTRIRDVFNVFDTEGFFHALGRALSGTGEHPPWNAPEDDLLIANAVRDDDYFGHSADKIVSPFVDNLFAWRPEPDITDDDRRKRLAKLVWERYKTRWAKLYATLTATYNPIENYDLEETETPNLTHDRTRDTTADNTVTTETDLGTYGYNGTAAADLVPQQKSTVTVTSEADPEKNIEHEVTTDTGVRTLIRHGNVGVTTTQEMLESERALWLWDYFEQIYKDIDTILTCGAY